MFRAAIIDTIVFTLPSTAAVETKVATVVFADERAFDRVPVPNLIVHRAIRLKPLPIGPRTHDHLSFILQLSHRFHGSNHESSSRARSEERRVGKECRS